ncbi:MAG TPA: type II toxin-antitoxin system RelE/ParE family toxin [Bryobacteraceae bacterium]|nr:type II toxin-antitoxin system RelE/ParE family toxin [Bryobacteraceae bacterium]
MAVELVIAPEAELDIAEAYTWYEACRVGLGEDFLTSVDACFANIRRQPEGCPLIHEQYRRSLIRRFPYAIFYERAETTVTVYSVFHTSRDPEKWRQRLP